MQQDFQWLAEYLRNPDTASLIGADGLATRGAAWSFLRYAADRKAVGPGLAKAASEAAFWRSLTASGAHGLANLERAFGALPLEWIHDWLVSPYADDLAPGLDPRFRQPSWNARALYPFLRTPTGSSYGEYPLKERVLADGATLALTIPAGGAAYARFAVPRGGRAEIRTASTAPSCLAGGPAIGLTLGEAAELTEQQAGAVCFEGFEGIEGDTAEAEFVYILVYAAMEGTRAVNLAGSGLASIVALQRPAAGMATPSPGSGDGFRAWEARFRESERRELTALIPRALSRSGTGSAASVEGSLRVTVVRIR
jgi:hypothetical protein